MRRFLAFMALPVVAAAGAALIPAGTGANVAADAQFDGVVNNAKKAATVNVVCPVPGQTTGVIKSGQTWRVESGTHGQMGDFGGSIRATVGTATADLTTLGTNEPIPVGTAPCTGFGAATFTPNDFGADARSTQVGVHFVGVAS